jgi:hypothetical protein
MIVLEGEGVGVCESQYLITITMVIIFTIVLIIKISRHSVFYALLIIPMIILIGLVCRDFLPKRWFFVFQQEISLGGHDDDNNNDDTLRILEDQSFICFLF